MVSWGSMHSMVNWGMGNNWGSMDNWGMDSVVDWGMDSMAKNWGMDTVSKNWGVGRHGSLGQWLQRLGWGELGHGQRHGEQLHGAPDQHWHWRRPRQRSNTGKPSCLCICAHLRVSSG